jgi:hypothetical protein
MKRWLISVFRVFGSAAIAYVGLALFFTGLVGLRQASCGETVSCGVLEVHLRLAWIQVGWLPCLLTAVFGRSAWRYSRAKPQTGP